MLERIRTLLTARQLTPTQFADTIGVSRPIVSHILSGRNKPSLEVVQKIVGAFPDLSLRWLLNGEGPMVAVQDPIALAVPSRARQAPLEPPQAPQPAVAPPAALPAPVEAPEPRAAAPVAVPVGPVSSLPVSAVSAPESSPITTSEPAVPLVAVIGADSKLVTGVAKESKSQPAPAGVALAQGLAEPGKSIRRIVIFYQDGTFADYQPEAAS